MTTPLIISLDNDSFSVLESSTQPSQQIQGLPQAKRTLQEVIELKAARRAEIERRALLLDPPLQPSVLAHIPSFQAALQIITPLGDNAWELLKPRLLLQRTDAEQREMHNQTMAQNSPSFEEQPKDTKELMDKDWDDAQAPLRARISMYADELIHDSWDDGGKVTKESSPRFAAEVLLEVRQKFYAIIAKEASAARVACREPIRDPPQGPFTQKLTLENMKWLFEVKVKPYTDPFRKELFLCRGCDDSTKAYGFEGVVQHYAAKHTKSMSVGNIVVYWRSEWPEIPPFHPDPVAKSTQFHNPIASVHLPPVQSQQYNQHRHPQPPLYGTAAAGQFGSTFPSHHGHPGNPQQYATYRPPGIYTQPQIPHISSYPQPPVPFHHAPGMPHNAVPPPFGVQAVSRYSHQPGSGFSGPPGALHYNHSYDSYYPIQQADYPNPPEDFQSERMRVQLEALAHNSRDIWMATAGIKNLPGYIRVYVCLHHLASRYRSQFAESPPLTMFLDGLANHKEMRPVRNVNELMCKACHLGLDNHVPDEKERTVFSLPQLVNHFQQRHIEPLQSSGGQLLDWTIDMVYLPEVTSLSELKAMTGMDTHKYGLITEAFPQSAFQENPSGQAPSTQFVPPQVSRGEVYDFEPRSGYLSIQNNGPLAPTSAGDHVYSNSGGGQSSVPNHDTPLAVPPQADGGQSQIMQSQTQGPHIISVAPGRPMAHDPSQTSGSNFRRNSPDWPVGKQRRKLSRKEHRAQSKQEAKLRRGNTKNGPGIKSRADSVDTEEDKEAEAEAQRQENAIRAMWEADRKATARVASTTTTLQAQGRDSPSGFPSRFLAPSVQVPTPAQNSVSQTAIDLRSRESSSRSVTDSEDDLFAGLESHLAQHNAARPVPVTAPVQQPSQMGVSLRAPETHSVSHNFDGHSHGHGHDRDLRADRSQSPHYEEPKLWYHPEYRERSPRIPAADRTYINQTRTEIEGVLPDHRAYADGYKETVPQDRRVIYTTEPHLHGISAIQHADRPPSHSAALVHYAQELPRRPVSSVQYTDPRLDHSVRPAPSNVAYEMYERVLVRESNGDEYYIERPVRRQPDPVYLRREEERPRYREPMAYGGYEHNDRRREAFYESFRRQEDSNDRRTTAGPAPIRPRSPQRYVTYDEAHRAAVESYDEYDPRFPGAASSFGPPRHVQYQ